MAEEKSTKRTRRKLKLVIYTHDFLPLLGGVQTQIELLGRGFMTFPGADGLPEFDPIVVTNTPANGFDDSSLAFPIVRNPALSQLVGLIRGADVLHLAGPALLPLVISWLLRTPTIVEHHGYQAICLNGALLHEPDRAVCRGYFQAGQISECLRCQRSELSSTSKSLLRLIATKMRNFLCRQVENVAITGHVLRRHDLPRSQVIYYGIEESLAGQAGGAPNSRDLAKVCFGYLGRLVPEKGVGVLLDAAGELHKQGHDFALWLIGDGTDRPRLESQIGQLDLSSRIHLTGFLSGEALSSLLQKIDVIIMPSVWEETAGLSAIEQMMRGRLVIASDIGGLSEVVSDAGILFPPGNAEALAERMSAVIAHPELIETLGFKARERALRAFKLERMLDEHAHLCRQVVAKRGPKSGI
ncbi:MAG: glycosyltransferase family 4 protein [Candidatus Acidiferrales bacterium]